MPQDLPFDIQRRVDEAKRRQTERQTEDTQRKRLRKKELLKALQLAKLRRQFSAFGFDDVDRELKRVAAARRAQDSFGNITLGDKASWLGPLAEGLLPPKPANERPVVKLNRPPVAKGLKFPTEDAHPPPAPAPPVGASGLRPVPPKPGLPKLPREPLPSLKLEKVRVKTKSEVYEPLTERETTGGMARGLARDDTVSSLYCSTPSCADDEPVAPVRKLRFSGRVNGALGRYAKAPRRWFFRRPRAAGVGRRKG